MCHFLGDFTRYSGHSLLTLVIYMKYSSPAFFPNQQLFKYFTVLKGHNQLLDGADLNTSFLTLKKSSPQLEIKVHLEIPFHFRSVLLDF